MTTLDSNNSNTIIDGAISQFNDFGGTDTYTIFSGLSNDVTITDNDASVVNLPTGLDISSVSFLSDGMQITVNGSTVTLLGSLSNFVFVFDGSPLNPAAGVARSYEQTAAEFGTSVPAPGAPANSVDISEPSLSTDEVNSFHLLIGLANGVQPQIPTAIENSNYDLYIIEAGNLSKSVEPSLTREELEEFAINGKTVIGYVNVSVTDGNRNYWDPNGEGWVIPDQNDQLNLDFGTVVESVAPSWLINNRGPAKNGDDLENPPFGFIVDYSDPLWRQIVIDDAVELIEAGYHGVYLDDVLRYFDAQEQNPELSASQAALEMIALVTDVSEAVLDVDPDAYIAINNGAFLLGDSALSANDQIWLDFLENIDGFLMENQYDPISNTGIFWQTAIDNFGNTNNPDGIDFLAIQNAQNFASQGQRVGFLNFANENNLIPFISDDENYDSPPLAGIPVLDADMLPIFT